MKKLFKKLKLIGLIIFTLFDIFLIYSCFYFGYSIYSSKYINSQDKFNKETVSYISFMFENNDNHVVDVKKPKIVSDDVGKLLFGDSYFTFDVNLDKEKINDSLEYVVTASPVGDSIDDEYIKFYLTDENGKSLTENEVMRFSEFDSSKDGSSKIIYEGKFTKDKTKQILNLRVWISEEYDYDDVAGFSYQLNILTK